VEIKLDTFLILVTSSCEFSLFLIQFDDGNSPKHINPFNCLINSNLFYACFIGNTLTVSKKS